MDDSKPRRHPHTGLPISETPTQQQVVEQATVASEQANDRKERNEETKPPACEKP